jgi:hypothetical protein
MNFAGLAIHEVLAIRQVAYYPHNIRNTLNMKEFIAVLSSVLIVSFMIILMIIYFGEPSANRLRSNTPRGSKHLDRLVCRNI